MPEAALIKRLIFAPILASVFMFTGTVVAQPPARSGYDEAWFDEFNGTALDTSLWTPSNTTVTTNSSLQDYLPSQISVAGGNMTILSEDIWSRGRLHRSGLIKSTALQKYGRWDIRAKLPTSKGMWPAIWLLSDAPWPSEGEIDIMENRGTESNLTSSAFHYGTNPPFQHNFKVSEQTASHDGSSENYHEEFHTYSVEWDPDQLRFYVDDVHHWTVRDSDVDGFLTDNVGGMRLIINTAIGGTFLENPVVGETVWPQRFEVDYVHAYNRSAEGKTLTFENGGFESNGGSLAHWTTFGKASFNNISSGNEQIADGNEAFKIFGQFNGNTNFSGIEQGISVSSGDELTLTADAFVASGDSISGTNNECFLKIDYYSEQYGLFGSPEYLGSDSIIFANSSTANNQWIPRELNSVAPQGAVEARAVIVFAQRDNAGGAVFADNVEFATIADAVLGDFDQDGDVDSGDVNFYTNNLGQPASFDARLDLDGNGTINLVDHDLHVNTLLQANGVSGTVMGDLNLDGTVDVLGDAFTLVGNLGATGVGYAEGDLNADGLVDVLNDAFRLVGNLGQSAASNSQ